MRLDSEWVSDSGRKWASPLERERLARAIRDIELRSAGESRLAIDPGWGMDGLVTSGIHEWFAGSESPGSGVAPEAPRAILAHVARAAIAPEHRPGVAGSRALIWIGRMCWPCPAVIPDLLACSIWIDPPDAASRLWAIDLALRCPGVGAVIADGCGLDMGSSRRLQLAAEAGRTIGLLARPARELRVLSAAATRWRISPAPTEGKRPRWTVELLRRKGVRPAMDASGNRCVVEWHHAQGARRVSPEVAGGTGAQARDPGAGRGLIPGRLAG
jgi:protein ImuA